MATTMRLILGDQLNANHSWFKHRDDDVMYVVAELFQETNYVTHHVQKLYAFFLAMQNFASALQTAGHQVQHLTLDNTAEHADLSSLIRHLCDQYSVQQFEYQRPDEYRLATQLSKLELPGVQITMVETEHFMLPFEEIPNYFERNQAKRMEAFYRDLRKRFNIMMRDNKPWGDRWNFDTENRNKLKQADLDAIPEPLTFNNGYQQIAERTERHSINHFGNIGDTLSWPVTRKQAIELLRHFCEYCLPNFGRFQDAMTQHSDHAWSLYHSRLSFALNAKMISPERVIDSAINAYLARPQEIDLAQLEGFVRQILGWREFVRGIYWANMPEYSELNALEADRDLPQYFWDGDTKMNCMKHAISQSLDTAYAHHIQRLMVTGNFCLLAGIDPRQVDEWYLGIYIDAIEWVELPNTAGMCQFADGGLVASKPYTASGAYINRMSDYCNGCHYKVKQKTGELACPFNSLYWHFMHRHRKRFQSNPRIGMVYRNLDKMKESDRSDLLQHAEQILSSLEDL